MVSIRFTDTCWKGLSSTPLYFVCICACLFMCRFGGGIQVYGCDVP